MGFGWPPLTVFTELAADCHVWHDKAPWPTWGSFPAGAQIPMSFICVLCILEESNASMKPPHINYLLEQVTPLDRTHDKITGPHFRKFCKLQDT